MTHSVITIQGIDVHIDGAGPDTVVMIHGWPDTHRLWDQSVVALQSLFKCVRFDLPGYDVDKPVHAMSLAQMTTLIGSIVDGVSPGREVVLLLHDWGCVFGYEFAAVRPDRVARIVSVDIGDYNSDAYRRTLSVTAKALVFAYQFWLAVAWVVGGATGDAMTRWMARKAGSPTAGATIGSRMNYPYAMIWFGVLGGFRGAAPVAPSCPVLFIYGLRKPFMFHSKDWVVSLAARPGCAVESFPTGHWVMAQLPDAFNRCVLAWLAAREARGE